MATASTKRGPAPKRHRTLHVRAQSNVESTFVELDMPSLADLDMPDFPDLDMPSFISQILGQYQDHLIHQVERDAKGKALAAVKQESRLMQRQAQERLHSVKSEVQQRAQAVLDRARQSIFEILNEEVRAIFGELEARFQGLLGDGGIGVNPEAPESVEQQWGKSQEPDGTPGEATPLGEMPALGGVTTAEALEEEEYCHEVCLELPPPLDLKPLMEFYAGLSEMKDVRIFNAVGSVEKGISFHVRPTEPSSLPHLLQALPCVSDVRDETARERAAKEKGEDQDDLPALRILLRPAGD